MTSAVFTVARIGISVKPDRNSRIVPLAGFLRKAGIPVQESLASHPLARIFVAHNTRRFCPAGFITAPADHTFLRRRGPAGLSDGRDRRRQGTCGDHPVENFTSVKPRSQFSLMEPITGRYNLLLRAGSHPAPAVLHPESPAVP